MAFAFGKFSVPSMRSRSNREFDAKLANSSPIVGHVLLRDGRSSVDMQPFLRCCGDACHDTRRVCVSHDDMEAVPHSRSFDLDINPIGCSKVLLSFCRGRILNNVREDRLYLEQAREPWKLCRGTGSRQAGSFGWAINTAPGGTVDLRSENMMLIG